MIIFAEKYRVVLHRIFQLRRFRRFDAKILFVALDCPAYEEKIRALRNSKGKGEQKPVNYGPETAQLECIFDKLRSAAPTYGLRLSYIEFGVRPDFNLQVAI